MKVYEAKITYKAVGDGHPGLCDSADRSVAYLDGAFDEDPTVEWFYVILLNAVNRPIGRAMITKGTATASLIHAREVLKPAILAGATAIIGAHNHPSGDPSPSSADLLVTRQLREACDVMKIDLLDHVIVGDKNADPKGVGYYSFANSGLL